MDIYIDGSSMGNPGDAGIGVIFCDGDTTVKNISRFIGCQTNNVAEYSALIAGLQEALILRLKHIRVFSDSQLLCRQLNGSYKVKNDNLKILFDQAKTLLKGFESVRIQEIPREKNTGADKLARMAVKEQRSKIGRIAAPRALKPGEESPSS